MRAQLDMNVIIALLDSGHVMHASACGHPSHAFWPQQINLLQEGLMRWERILGPRQITNAYLPALAVAHGGLLVSFVQLLDPQEVRGRVERNCGNAPSVRAWQRSRATRAASRLKHAVIRQAETSGAVCSGVKRRPGQSGATRGGAHMGPASVQGFRLEAVLADLAAPAAPCITLQSTSPAAERNWWQCISGLPWLSFYASCAGAAARVYRSPCARLR